MNHTIKILLISDVFIVTGFGLMSPILAIFFKEDLAGGTIIAAGVASTVFMVVKCLIQLPFSRFVDRQKYDQRFFWLVIGSLLISIVPFLYIFAKDIYAIYIAQVVYGIGSGLAYPTWVELWTTHLDRRHESFEWSMYSSSVGLGTAAAAVIGAVIAQYFGFTATFIGVGVLSLGGCFTLLGLDRHHHHFPFFHRNRSITYHKRRKLGANRNGNM